MSNRPSARHRRCSDPGRNEQPSEAASQAALRRYRLGDQDPCGLRGRPGRPDPCPLPGPQHRQGLDRAHQASGSLGVAGVAIERSDGPLVEAMLEADLRVVMVTPRQVKSLRSRYRASGAKSDPADAYLLADVLRTDGHRLAALTPDSEPTKILRALSR